MVSTGGVGMGMGVGCRGASGTGTGTEAGAGGTHSSVERCAEGWGSLLHLHEHRMRRLLGWWGRELDCEWSRCNWSTEL